MFTDATTAMNLDFDVSPYRVDRKLAEGGMGVVYAAEHEVLGRKVALKVLHPHVAAVPESVARFRREAQVLAKLEHPHAVKIYDFVVDRPRPFLVMELVEGPSLAAVLEQRGPLPFAQVQALALQVLEVLAVAHAQGVVHRDLKPANLMLDATHAEPWVKVVDFGIALLHGEQNGRLTAEGQVTGTAAYMSPEQVNGAALDPRADLYSLACVLFELVSGRKPFESASAITVLSAHLFREPPLIEDVSTVAVPFAWQAALRKALSKPPEARFESAQAMGEALREAERLAARGPEARPASFEPDAGDAFVAAQVDDAPVALSLGAAPQALKERILEVLSGVGATVTHHVERAGVVLVADAQGAGAVEQLGRLGTASRPVLVCLDERDWGLVNRALQRGAFDLVPLPLESTDLARRVVRALRHHREQREST